MKVSVLGVGIMGGGMARQLAREGFDVTVWNRNAAKACALVPAGARVAATPACAAAGCRSGARDAGRRRRFAQPCGWAAGCARGDARRTPIAIESSTLTVDWIRELAAAAQVARCGISRCAGYRQQGAGRERGPVVPGRWPAELLERVRPALAAMGTSIAHLGPDRQRLHDETHQQFPLRRTGGESRRSDGDGRTQWPRRSPGGRGARPVRRAARW